MVLYQRTLVVVYMTNCLSLDWDKSVVVALSPLLLQVEGEGLCLLSLL